MAKFLSRKPGLSKLASSCRFKSAFPDKCKPQQRCPEKAAGFRRKAGGTGSIGSPWAAQGGCRAQGLAPTCWLKARRACALAPQVSQCSSWAVKAHRPRAEQDPHLSNFFSSKTFSPNVSIHRDSVYEQMKEAAPWLKLGGMGDPPLPPREASGAEASVCRDLRTPHLGLWESAFSGWLCPLRP